MALSGKNALVTGASGGIGQGIAVEFAKNGANVIVHYSGNVDKANETKELCEKHGVKAFILKADLSQISECERLIKESTELLGQIDILVNNAGITRDKLLIGMKDEDFTDVINTNLQSTFFCTKFAAKLMMKKRFGRIINITSVVGIHGNAGQANYSASKAGVIGFTKSVAKEIASRGVTVNAIAPGFIDTDMTKAMPEAAREGIVSQIPAKRVGVPEDIARAAVFFAKEDSDYITGQVLSVDGGMWT